MSEHQANDATGLNEPRQVAFYQSYRAARSAVTALTGEGLPPHELTIVGHDLRDESFAGPSWGKVLLTGVFSGLMWGLLLSVLLWIFLPGHAVWVIVCCGIGFGVVYGMLAQAVQHAMMYPSRASGNAAIATRFEVQAEAGLADRARDVIDGLPPIEHPADGHVGLVEHLMGHRAAKADEPVGSPAPDEPPSRPRRAVVEDEHWLAAGATPPVPDDELSHLAQQPTELIPILPLDDPVVDTSDKLRTVADTSENMHPVSDTWPYVSNQMA